MTLKNQADGYANRVVNEAKGDAERILQAAEGYKQQTVAEASGQTSRFLQVYEEYKKAPDVTRQRLFLETMETRDGRHGQDQSSTAIMGGQGVIPYLPLDQLQKRTPPAARRREATEMRTFLAFLFVLLLTGAAALYSSAFIVHQNEQALVLRFGKPVNVINKPGLNWKIPVVDTVDIFDKRILDLDASPQEVTTLDPKRLVVDAFARYKIVDPLQFYQTLRYEGAVSSRLGPILESALRGVLGSVTLSDIVRGQA